MKRAFAIVFLVFAAAGFIFATTWNTVDLVDDFGDLTGEKRLVTWVDDVKYGDYSWEYEDCAVMIDKGISGYYFIPLFYVGPYAAYQEWNIKIKLDDGTVKEYAGKLSDNNYISPENYADRTNIISDLKKGCKIVLYPENKYVTYKYNLGYIILTYDDLARLF